MKINIRKYFPILLTINIALYSALTYILVFPQEPIIKSAEPIVIEAKKIEQAAVKKVDASNIVDLPKSNHFPFGQCTWYVASKRNVPWSGNAIDWFLNSQKFGRKVGKTPKVGAILVTRESWVGHVAYVEKVIGDNFTVSEMNNPTWGKVTKRNLTVKEVPFVGFIY